MGVIPEWVRDGWGVMANLLDSDVYVQMHKLAENPKPLFDALNRYPFTLLHGDFREENLAYGNHPIAFDWQEATCSLMTIDLIWFAKHGCLQNVVGVAQAFNHYRERLETYLGKAFGEQEWQAMIALGGLVDALRSTCFISLFSKHSDNVEHEQYNLMLVEQHSQYVRDARRWL